MIQIMVSFKVANFFTADVEVFERNASNGLSYDKLVFEIDNHHPRVVV